MKKKRSITRRVYARIDWERAAQLFRRSVPPTITRDSKYPSTKDILRIVASAGVVGMSFVFPNAAAAFGPFLLGDKPYGRWEGKHMLNHLCKKKFVSIKENNDGTVTVKITKKGTMRALTYELDTLALVPTKRWDKKWRVVIFDIPEKYRKLRDIFRLRIRQLGLYQLQESVYVSPYRCFDEIEFLRELYGVAFTVQYMLVDKIENDELLRSRFEITDS